MTQVVKKVKLLADSSCDLLSLEGIDYASVPLTISAGNIDYIDNETLDTNAMLDALMAYKGRLSRRGTVAP